MVVPTYIEWFFIDKRVTETHFRLNLAKILKAPAREKVLINRHFRIFSMPPL